MKKKCPRDKILNPATNRCVKKDGAIGKKIISTIRSRRPRRRATSQVSRPRRRRYCNRIIRSAPAVLRLRNIYPPLIKKLSEFLTYQIGNIQLCSDNRDGRINSIKDEATLITLLRTQFKIREPRERYWYDVSIQDNDTKKWIHFNIKVSKGGTDNALNKKAIVYSYSNVREKEIPNTLNLNRMTELIESNRRINRNPYKEYYYLYVDKIDGTIVIRSICDIQNFIPNPQNWLQIKWKSEKQTEIDFSEKYNQAYNRIMNVLATSLRKLLNTSDAILAYT